MRRFLIFAALVLGSRPLLGTDFVVGPPPQSPGPTATLGELVSSRPGVQPQAHAAGSASGFDFQILGQVVINAPGRFGTNFLTDYFIWNARSIDQDILVGILQAGVPGTSLGTTRYMLRANTIYSIPDFLGSGQGRLNYNGVGSLVITSVLPNTSTVDPGGAIAGYVRVWTKDPNSTGTNSFAFPATSLGMISGNLDALSVGVRQNSDFRANFGILNFDTVSSHTWTVNFVGGGAPLSSTATIPPLSMQQLAVPSTFVPSANGYFAIDFRPEAGLSSRWSAYGVSADNVTGDAWFLAAIQFLF